MTGILTWADMSFCITAAQERGVDDYGKDLDLDQGIIYRGPSRPLPRLHSAERAEGRMKSAA